MVLAAFTTTLMMVGILTFPIEKAYFGTKVTVVRNILSFFIALAVAIAGGIIAAFPIAYSLFQKGAKMSVIITFISAAAVIRIPMTLFEASFLGIKFTLVRLLVSIPLVVISSILLGNFLEKKNYRIMKG